MIRGSTMRIKEALSWLHSNVVSGALLDSWANTVSIGENTVAPNQGYIALAQLRFFQVSKQLLGAS